MKIVIDIPEEMHKSIEQGSFGAKYTIYDLVGCVMNGKPLPKGHGDLIDRSKLVPDCNELEIHDGDDWRNEYCGVSLMQIEQYAEVIVKADGGDAE